MEPTVPSPRHDAGHPRGGRWDGWNGPDHEPTQAELEEPVAIPGIENATPEDLARAFMQHRPSAGIEHP